MPNRIVLRTCPRVATFLAEDFGRGFSTFGSSRVKGRKMGESRRKRGGRAWFASVLVSVSMRTVGFVWTGRAAWDSELKLVRFVRSV